MFHGCFGKRPRTRTPSSRQDRRGKFGDLSGAVDQKEDCAVGHEGPARVLDLFAGYGGLLLRFQTASFEVVAALENDTGVARTHGLNFHGCEAAHGRPRDITRTHPAELARRLKLGPADAAINVIAGGPPHGLTPCMRAK